MTNGKVVSSATSRWTMSIDRSERIRARLDAPSQVALMLLELERRSPGAVEELREDPIAWLQAWNELDLRLLGPQPDMPADSPHCDVEGGYRATTPLPRIGVGHSTPARMNFTAVHELGHHLQRTTDELVDNLGVRDDLGEALEEAACDAFAAAVLIPEETASVLLGAATPSATDVTALWRSLPAVSRQAIVVRASKNLETDGHVILLTDDGVVEICGSRGAFRLPRGSDQSNTAIWDAFVRTRGVTAEIRTRFRYSNGLEAGETMYAQATAIGQGHVVIVAAVERVPWQLSVYQHTQVQYGTLWTCERTSCGATFEATTRCKSCGTPVCPECDYCVCRKVEEFTCTECFLIKPIVDQSAEASVCVDCAG